MSDFTSGMSPLHQLKLLDIIPLRIPVSRTSEIRFVVSSKVSVAEEK